MMGTVARSHSPSSEALNLFIVQQSLLGDDMPSTGASGAYLMAYEKLRKPVSRSEQWVGVVTALSTVAIILSDLTYLGFLFLGLSLDIDPNWAGWIVLEGICAMIFVAEVVVKTY
ncbi:HERC1, partial [Symbiodinium microadriaticum]